MNVQGRWGSEAHAVWVGSDPPMNTAQMPCQDPCDTVAFRVRQIWVPVPA